MNQIELKYNNQTEMINIPENWNELSRKQLLYIAKYWEAWKLLAQNKQSLLRAKSLLFVELMCGSTFFNKNRRLELIVQLTNEELYSLTELTNFIFEANTLTICPIPYIKTAFRKFYAPNNRLGNITAFEFAFADSFFMKYMDGGELESLELLIATIYRPYALFTRKRKAFDRDKINYSLKAVKKLSYAEKQLILLWYMGCRIQIIENNSALFSNENQSSAKNNGWLPVILALSGDKFGSFDQTGHTDLHLIFMELHELKERNKPKTAQ
jgi:hypothetical protein